MPRWRWQLRLRTMVFLVAILGVLIAGGRWAVILRSRWLINRQNSADYQVIAKYQRRAEKQAGARLEQMIQLQNASIPENRPAYDNTIDFLKERRDRSDQAARAYERAVTHPLEPPLPVGNAVIVPLVFDPELSWFVELDSEGFSNLCKLGPLFHPRKLGDAPPDPSPSAADLDYLRSHSGLLKVILNSRNLPDLAILDLGGSLTNDKDLSHIKALGKLRVLLLRGARISDSGVAYIAGLRNLRKLDLGQTPITSAGLVHLRGLTRLEDLSLMDNWIGDEALSHLRGLIHLKRLNLARTHIEDAGLEHLRPLRDLEELSLGHNPLISDNGAAFVVELRNLRKLDLDATGITDATLARLSKLKGLKQLSLGRTRITDAGLVHLKGLVALERLDLSDTMVGDSGLAHLASLRALEYLDLTRTKVSDAGLANLKAVLPVERLELSRRASRLESIPVPELPSFASPFDLSTSPQTGPPSPARPAIVNP